MRRIVFPPAALTVSFAGCSQPVQDSAVNEPSPAPTTASSAGAAPSASPTIATEIPERFRGVWDYAEESSNPASDLRLAIRALSIEFHESLGTVIGLVVESPDDIGVDMAMEGEGERWTARSVSP